MVVVQRFFCVVSVFGACCLAAPAWAQAASANSTTGGEVIVVPLQGATGQPDVAPSHTRAASAPLPQVAQQAAPRPALPVARPASVEPAELTTPTSNVPNTQVAQASPSGPPIVPAPEAAPPSPRFDIERYDVQGNTLLTADRIDAVVAPFVGRGKDFADVQRALEALQAAYQQRGYGAVQVLLPEQELERGVVSFRVIEPRIGKIVVEGNKVFDEANIRASLPSLKEGETPNAIAVGRNARLANENPSKRTTVLLRAGANEGEVDATVRVDDEKTWRAAVNFDNTGSPTTGRYRLGFAYQNANLWNRDHTLTMQYQLDPEPIDDLDHLKVFGLGYRIPFYRTNSQLDFLFGYSTLGSTQAQVIPGVPLSFSGSGTIFGVRYTQILPRFRFLEDFDQRVSIGLDYKAFSNSVSQAGGPNQVPDVTVYPMTIAYSASKRWERSELGFFASMTQNIYTHGSDAFPERFFAAAPDGVRPGAGTPHYFIRRFGVNYSHALPNNVQFRFVASLQDSRDALVPGEQFGIGGWDSVRGLREREASSDHGYRTSFEVYSPDIGKLFTDKLRLRMLGFVDSGRVKQNFTQVTPCTLAKCVSAMSYGVGARLAFPRNVTMRLDWGHLHNGGVDSERGQSRIHFGMAIGF